MRAVADALDGAVTGIGFWENYVVEIPIKMAHTVYVICFGPLPFQVLYT
jgi:hypothetical protein